MAVKDDIQEILIQLLTAKPAGSNHFHPRFMGLRAAISELKSKKTEIRLMPIAALGCGEEGEVGTFVLIFLLLLSSLFLLKMFFRLSFRIRDLNLRNL